MNAKIIAIANQKGGTGKTATTMNLGYALSEAGKKVLVIDFDPQHNLTNYLSDRDHEFTIAEAISYELQGDSFPRTPIYSYEENLDYIPTTLNLSAIDMQLITANAREYILSDILEKLEVKSEYDYVIIDCMPALNTLLINALTAADSVIIPVEASYGAFEGLGQLFTYVNMVTQRLNRDLTVDGIIYTKVNNTKIANEVRDRLKECYPELLFDNEIKELTEARKSYAERIPLSKMQGSRLASDYANLAKELVDQKGALIE
ncbi:ParA family protein [Hutsoniella sourekii]|uniref:ParA family protein n=1 Tax=Hutsoniella sourekii TaxID=87650 RepID=UPI000489A46A|nr:AAA family ATPase [Hutsoniella sourekii]